MTLTEQQINNLSCYYSTQYNIEDMHDNLVGVLDKHSHDQKYYLYRTICKNIGFAVLNNKSFKAHINQNRNFQLLDEMNQLFYIKVLQR